MPEVLNIAGIEIEYDESLFDLNAIADNANEISHNTQKKKKRNPDLESEEKENDDSTNDDTDEFFDPIADADNIVMTEPIAFDEYPFN